MSDTKGAPAGVPELASHFEDAVWRSMSGRSLKEQVLIAEEALSHVEPFAKEMKEALMKIVGYIPDAKHLLHQIERDLTPKAIKRILVGVRGKGAAGKSFMINALLDLGEAIVPHGEQGIACTAATIKISESPPDAEYPYYAKIKYLRATEWEEQLRQLHDDIREDFNTNQADPYHDIDPDLSGRIKLGMDKVTSVYPEITTAAMFLKTDIDELMQHEHVKDILDEELAVGNPKIRTFCKSVEPYCSTQPMVNAKGQQYEVWPLIESIKFELDANILKHGITLVDLPGANDSNEARGAIGASFESKLHATCVVTNSDRAAADAVAADILGAGVVRKLLMDGVNSHRVCAVLSKCDIYNEPRSEIKRNPSLRASTKDLIDAEKTIATQLEDHKNEVACKEKELSAFRKKLKNLKDGSAIKKEHDDRDESSVSVEKQITTEQMSFYNIRETLYELKTRHADLRRAARKLNSMVVRECIRARTENIRQILQRQYASSLGPNSTLNIYQISSLAHTRIINKQQPPAGFISSRDTGVEDVQEFIRSLTYRPRLANALSVLEGVVFLRIAMQPLLCASSADAPIPSTIMRDGLQIARNAFDEIDLNWRQNFQPPQGASNLVNELTVEQILALNFGSEQLAVEVASSASTLTDGDTTYN